LLGAEVKGGGGYEQLPVHPVGSKTGYLLKGGYLEGGAGGGVDINAKLLAKALTNPTVIKALVTLFKYGGKITGSIPDMPSGSLYQLIFGPNCKQSALSRSDFENSVWIYIYLGGTFVAFGGDAGLLFLMDGKESARSVLTRMADPRFGNSMGTELPKILWDGTKAWCPYAGSSVSFGLSGGAIVRAIGMVSIGPSKL
jgi:hypothetical protein